MPNLSHYEKLIQEKRKKTPFRDFVREIASWDVMNLYKRNNQVCRYPESDRIKKLGDEFWEVAETYERLYDYKKNLFENIRNLQDTIPMQYTLRFGTNENCEYMDGVLGAKNIYLSFIICFDAQDILYSAFCYDNVSSIINSFLVCKNSSEVADSIGVTESYKIFYSKNIANSSNIWFSTNLIGCHDCIGCDALENKKYMINNIEYTKELYENKKQEILKDKKSFPNIWKHIQERGIENVASENITGVGVIKSENIENGLWVSYFFDCRNVGIGNGANGARNQYDCIDVGYNASDYFAVIGGGGNSSRNIYCSMQIVTNSDSYYCMYMVDSHHCLGCIGLKNKSYCILNKQYTKEEWEVLAEEIFASMEADGTLGEFFPATMNPFYFNDTLAYLIDDSFTKEEVEKEGYLWRDEAINVDIPEGSEIIKSTDLNRFQGFREDTWYIDPAIMTKVIVDEKGNYYRIVKMEYDFLIKHALPLPTIHWLDRMKMGFR